MSSNTIVNGAPMTIMRGIQDLSIRTLPIEAEVLPTHLPKVYIYAQKGPTTPQLVSGNSRNLMYGDDTFDLRKPYATHQTVLSNLVNAKGNAQMIERVIPADAGPKSNFTLWIDVLPEDVPMYTRDASRMLVLDSANLPQPTGSVSAGHRVKFVTTSNDTETDEVVGSPTNGQVLFGNAKSKVGSMVGGYGGTVQSTMYPILEFQASSYGEVFNNSGIRISAPTVDSANAVDLSMMEGVKAYPFRLQAIRRATETSTPSIVATEFSESFFDFVLKPNQINPATDAKCSLGDIFLNKYQNLTDLRFPMKFGDFGQLKIYQNNIDTLVNMFYAAEMVAPAGITEFTGDADKEKYLFNFINGTYSSNVPYYTYVIDSGSIRLASDTNLYAKGGFDGTMFEYIPGPTANKEDFDALVARFASGKTTYNLTTTGQFPYGFPPSFDELVEERVAEYGNPVSSLMDSAVNAESIMYDSGFCSKTKKAMGKFISERKDTAVVLSTYEVNGSKMTASEEHSMASALRASLVGYLEADYYGTVVTRGMIVGRYGDLRNTQYSKQLPLTLEIAAKASEMMGAGNGRWKAEALFDKAPNSEVFLFDNVNVTYTPATVRNKDWEIGLNWVQSFTRKSVFFPALKTVYDNDTSVLNSFFTMMACVELQKVGERVWRLFSGSTSLTDAQLIDRVNSAVEERTVGRFAGMFKIVPAAYKTDADIARGFSYTLPIKIYANNLSTVMTLSIEAHRMSELGE